ncbi:hypothetical protein E2C01_100470 [Portunus trituberculatus]|uniref:Uncharacterized protein n=1 Tax=Portunus trituberculatus TaxID=210409 RepID=A0A5B7KDF0_PORTR|nr:hypothetical protein [Portunus trituberculatus]
MTVKAQVCRVVALCHLTLSRPSHTSITQDSSLLSLVSSTSSASFSQSEPSTSRILTMATSHILVICSIITASSSLELPVRDVPTIADAEFSVLDFIRLSFQPLLITDALQQITLDTLAPWTFPAFHSSIEAATTFCVASKGSEGEGEDEEGKGNNDVPMSLRRFSMEGSGDSSRWQHAFTIFTKELG